MMTSLAIFDAEQLIHKSLAMGQRRREHFGLSQASLVKCARMMWLEDRWCFPLILDGRKLMIFRLGDKVEDLIVENLPGHLLVSKTNEQQEGGKMFGGHVGWHVDGLACSEQGVFAIVEIKSVNQTRFNRLVKLGDLKQWDEQYWCQCIGYMGAMREKTGYDIQTAEFVALCKNDSRLYQESIEFDPYAYEQIKEKIGWLVALDAPPPPEMNESDYRVRNFMDDDDQGVYLGRYTPKQSNCRNCRYAARDLKDERLRGRWGCRKHRKIISFAEQQRGCRSHEWVPELVPAQLIDDETMLFESDNGFQFRNGEEHLTSGQIAWLCRNDWQRDEVTHLVDEFEGEVEIL